VVSVSHAAHCGVGWVTRVAVEIRQSTFDCQSLIIRLPGQPERSPAEHEAIVEALEHRTVDEGVALVTAHITNLKEAALEAMARTA